MKSDTGEAQEELSSLFHFLTETRLERSRSLGPCWGLYSHVAEATGFLPMLLGGPDPSTPTTFRGCNSQVVAKAPGLSYTPVTSSHLTCGLVVSLY